MATSIPPHCTDCKYHLKITHDYCYHPDKLGTLLDDAQKVPAWCPLKHAP
jgi:hypothetical protein